MFDSETLNRNPNAVYFDEPKPWLKSPDYMTNQLTGLIIVCIIYDIYSLADASLLFFIRHTVPVAGGFKGYNELQ